MPPHVVRDCIRGPLPAAAPTTTRRRSPSRALGLAGSSSPTAGAGGGDSIARQARARRAGTARGAPGSNGADMLYEKPHKAGTAWPYPDNAKSLGFATVTTTQPFCHTTNGDDEVAATLRSAHRQHLSRSAAWGSMFERIKDSGVGPPRTKRGGRRRDRTTSLDRDGRAANEGSWAGAEATLTSTQSHNAIGVTSEGTQYGERCVLQVPGLPLHVLCA